MKLSLFSEVFGLVWFSVFVLLVSVFVLFSPVSPIAYDFWFGLVFFLVLWPSKLPMLIRLLSIYWQLFSSITLHKSINMF